MIRVGVRVFVDGIVIVILTGTGAGIDAGGVVTGEDWTLVRVRDTELGGGWLGKGSVRGGFQVWLGHFSRKMEY